MSTKDLKYKSQFEFLFREYFNALFNYINAQINDREISREIVQSCYMKIWKSRFKIDLDSPAIKSYLYTTAKNNLIDYIRKKERQGGDKVAIDNLEAVIPAQEDHYFNDQLFRSEIVKALNELKPRTKTIFIMNKFEGLTYKEIAEDLGISKRAVEDNIARALIRLKEILYKKKDLFY